MFYVCQEGGSLYGPSGLCGGHADGLGRQRIYKAYTSTYLGSLWSRQAFRTWKSFLSRKSRGSRKAFLPLLKKNQEASDSYPATHAATTQLSPLNDALPLYQGVTALSPKVATVYQCMPMGFTVMPVSFRNVSQALDLLRLEVRRKGAKN